ncbi:putative mitochondrial hypothetical protein [Leptomonas pyrrhocoris]|uniref:Uncharacterized protein n=1 Tax=Leptomonas pyrrhocoris TaxID=157538 RepID=A0A0N0VGH4_LEPPY|nr:putative mitochondrial hypothetical protein [Leptomonas pyrrhocoris]KPA83078.1 putative mitochondrial hypothetical protein [Leptomonas pyrrhocoris]|eukprot:XP_015661517.1 putative mitochondrial hypothetical protein [Leptomonas pyrrhocoris]
MGVSYRFGARAAVALMLLMCFIVLPAAVMAQQGTSTVAGWVDVQPDVAPYVVLRVVDDSTGVVVRSAPLDATHTFSFAGIVPSSVSVEAVAQLPDHLFVLDAASSVLKTPVTAASATATVQLKVAATSKTGVAAATAAAGGGGSVASAALALVALVAAWCGRHRIVSALDMPAFKPLKPRKVMVTM